MNLKVHWFYTFQFEFLSKAYTYYLLIIHTYNTRFTYFAPNHSLSHLIKMADRDLEDSL